MSRLNPRLRRIRDGHSRLVDFEMLVNYWAEYLEAISAASTDLAQHALDFAETRTAIVEQDRQLDELVIRPFTLKNSISFSTSSSSGRFVFINSCRSRTFPTLR